MKKGSTIFLQAVIVLIGIGVATFLLWEPHLEGVNANATTLREIYFDDPFLAYIYASFISFFIALYQAFRVLGYIRHGKTFSGATLKALRTIRYCGMALGGLIAAPVAYLFIVRPGDDIAGGVAMGLFLILVSALIASAAAVFEGVVKSAADVKSGQS